MAFWAEPALLVGDLWASSYSPSAKAAMVGPLEPTSWSGFQGHFVSTVPRLSSHYGHSGPQARLLPTPSTS